MYPFGMGRAKKQAFVSPCDWPNLIKRWSPQHVCFFAMPSTRKPSLCPKIKIIKLRRCSWQFLPKTVFSYCETSTSFMTPSTKISPKLLNFLRFRLPRSLRSTIYDSFSDGRYNNASIHEPVVSFRLYKSWNIRNLCFINTKRTETEFSFKHISVYTKFRIFFGKSYRKHRFLKFSFAVYLPT